MLRQNKCPQPNYPPTLKGYRWVYNERLNIWEEEPYDWLTLNDIRILNGLSMISKSEPVNDMSKITRILFGEGVE